MRDRREGTVVSDRQRQFRESYRANISSFYNGFLHVAVTFGAGFAAIAAPKVSFGSP